jgi:C-terminal processing protease CtpA/Prc
VVVLVSARTAGPAEDFLVAFRGGNRGPIIGEASAGSTGQTAVLPLPGGWQFRVTVTRDAFPDGKEFMRTGVVPDMPVEERVADVLVGRDAAWDRARAYLAETARR